MARPSKYKKEFTNYTYKYIENTDIPYIEELALALEVDEDTIGNWCKATHQDGTLKYPEFLGAIKALKTKQKFMLQKLGLSSKINSTMAIFQLKVNHGFIESQHIDHTTKGESLNNVDLTDIQKLSPEELQAILRDNNRRTES